jgi:hypothetical protein
MNLESQLAPVRELTAGDREQMLALMRAHYEGVSERRFAADLGEKQWAILLRHQGRLCGFSTQAWFDHPFAGKTVKILFSGDTIIDKTCWGSLALPIAWGRMLLSLRAAHPGVAIYWLLTSKGYKTYRFLPVFFREFYPCHTGEAPAFERGLLRSVAVRRFGARFAPAAGLLRAEPGDQRLRPGVAELNDQRLRDPHVAFFQRRNPGHARGDELVCLARFHPDNLTPYIRRQL